jgi:uncharacterized membrane protein YccC
MLRALRRDVAELELRGERANQPMMAALSVMISVLLALWLELDMAWWAGISAFISTQATAPGSLRRAALRIFGTAIGAAVIVVVMPFVAEDHLLMCLLLFALAFTGVLGMSVSRYGYVWLFVAVTGVMVTMLSVNDPSSVYFYAFDRTLEVVVGSLVALVVTAALAPDRPEPMPPAASGWGDLLGTGWPYVRHALNAGIAAMLLLPIWSALDLPGPSQMAVTIAAVLAIPVVSGDPRQASRMVVRRSVHRGIGCLLGGCVALVLLTLPLAELFLPWLLTLGAATWIGTHVQASTRGVSYVGTQGAVAFIITWVQGFGPPTSIVPGVERFAGVLGGLVILSLVLAVITPLTEPDTA